MSYKLENLGYKINKFGKKDDDGSIKTTRATIIKNEHDSDLQININAIDKVEIDFNFNTLTAEEIAGLYEFLDDNHLLKGGN